MIARKKLGEILVRYYKVSEEKVDTALAAQRSGAGRLGDALLRLDALSEEDLVRALAFQLGIPIALNLADAEIAPQVLNTIPTVVAAWDRVIPIAKVQTKDGRPLLVVAMCDPTDESLRKDLEALTKCTIQPAITTEKDIGRALRRFYAGRSSAIEPPWELTLPSARIPSPPDLDNSTAA